MAKKYKFYTQYGVEEYYIYDPDKNKFIAYHRNDHYLREQLGMPSFTWYSPWLDVRFELLQDTLKIYGPDGKVFLTYVERTASEEKERERAEKEAALAEVVCLKELLKKAGLDED